MLNTSKDINSMARVKGRAAVIGHCGRAECVIRFGADCQGR